MDKQEIKGNETRLVQQNETMNGIRIEWQT